MVLDWDSSHSCCRLGARSKRDVEAGFGFRLRPCSPTRNSVHENSAGWA